jgi:predicted metal-dependent peptidase|tara:strand:+ start:73 stop:1335 length:1263 start_codon:yes stop_codon:yes gene_type:complete
MSDTIKKPFNLNMHTARLLMNEPFFAALSRRIEKVSSTTVPTAGVRVNPDSAQFELIYNPEFMGALSDNHKLGVLKHEFYHIILEHVTGRRPPGGLKRIDNIAMDLAINSHISTELPRDACPGPMIDGEPMKACIPGEGVFSHLPMGETYEWYKSKLEDEMSESEDGDGGEGGEPGEGGEGSGQPGQPQWADSDSFDSHDDFGDCEGTTNEIAKERLRDSVKKAAEEAEKARNWGSVSSSMRQNIMERISTKVDWRKVLRYFIKTSQRSERMSTPRRINRRFPKIHPGKRVRRHAKIAISIDQSGSVDDAMLAAFFSELNKLAEIAEFTVVPFDTRVAEDKVYTWKKGQARKTERVLTGGTCFNAPTKYVNARKFDGHIVLTDMMAPKPVASTCQRMWMTTAQHAKRPYFATSERVISVN